MAAKAFFHLLRRRLHELRQADAANVTITFALAAIPVVGMVGAAIDYGHASAVKTSMQSAADATALMLSKHASKMTEAEIQQKGCEYFQALVPKFQPPCSAINVNYTTTGGSQITVNATADVPTDFMSVVRIPVVKVGVESQVKWGNTRLRVALVLDNTGSMSSDGKMTALQTATKKLLDQLRDAASRDGDVYVSIIPFAKDVNVGASNYNADWLYWDNDAKNDTKSWDGNNGTCSDGKTKTRASCITRTSTTSGRCSISGNRNQSDCEDAGVCSRSNYTSKRSCENNNGRWTTGQWTGDKETWTPASHSTWNGCVVDRGNPSGPADAAYDTNVLAPNRNIAASLFAAEQHKSCPEAIMPLSYNWDAMKLAVDDMSPSGNTNQGIGLAHGWMSLFGGGPYPAPPPLDADYEYQHVIILMTDGLNTENRWQTRANRIDERQQITCDNVNAADVTLYAIQVNTGGDPTSTLLQNCAGTAPGRKVTRKYPDPDKFFLLTSADQLVATFQRIGTALSNLRIAQ